MLTYGMVCWAFLLIFFQRDRDGLMANRIVAVPGTFVRFDAQRKFGKRSDERI